MKVLWLCNIMLPAAAHRLGREASNKEGWISGMADAVLTHQQENEISLSIAFPMSGREMPDGQDIYCDVVELAGGASYFCYGFPEDVRHPEKYDRRLELSLKKIVDRAAPDIVHCFGTEYPHTLAMCRVFPRKDRLLVGLQGLCTLYAEAYYANLPEKTVHSVTLRDILKRDSLRQQKKKFAQRGNRERKAVSLAGNLTGRTEWDRISTGRWNPDARYYPMNETLRAQFYDSVWKQEECIPHSIFLSQGDYPIKGLHYMLLALPAILAVYPDARVCVAGNSIVNYGTIKQKLKISAYGKYLRGLMKQEDLEDRVEFLGNLNGEQMRDRYLKSHLFVCCSSVENSPNSLGEAMLLGVPCVSADVGGISSIFTGGTDGILYEGFREAGASGEDELKRIAGSLADAVLQMWSDPQKMTEYCGNARRHARKNHNGEENYRRLVEIYGEIL